MRIRTSLGDKTFDVLNYVFLSLLGIITLYPILNVVAISLSDYASYVRNPLMVFPVDLDLSAYGQILTSPLLLSSYRNTIFVTVVGTILNVTITVLTAYPLAKAKIRGDRWVMFVIILTMLFSGGMIPTFLVVKGLHLYNTLWAVMIPTLISTYNFIIVKTFFESIPDALEESAKIDGAGHLYILFKIVIPLSLPLMATISLFYGVANWNRFFEAMLYLNDRSNWTLTILLREIITENSDLFSSNDPMATEKLYPKTMQSATIVVAILPILFSYPFMQKYFIKGIMLGAVKQ
jgi:putative aldouronate transport system permease protein